MTGHTFLHRLHIHQHIICDEYHRRQFTHSQPYNFFNYPYYAYSGFFLGLILNWFFQLLSFCLYLSGTQFFSLTFDLTFETNYLVFFFQILYPSVVNRKEISKCIGFNEINFATVSSDLFETITNNNAIIIDIKSVKHKIIG